VARGIVVYTQLFFSGELYMIVGPVGSGKSSLLSAFLGEMFLQQGRLQVKR